MAILIAQGSAHRSAICPRRRGGAGLKPPADEIRKMSPLGSPRREGQHDQTRRTPEEKRSQVDPPHGRNNARVHRRGRSRHQSPLRLLEYMDGPASLASHLAAGRASRGLLNGFPGLLAGVLGGRVGGGHRRPWDRSPQGLSDAAKVGKPAYPRYNRGLARDSAPSIPNKPRAPMDCAGGGVAPLPPVTAHRDG